MKKLLLLYIFSIISGVTFSQDIHFSQTASTPLWINPALTGLFDGWERVTASQRNQWIGANTQFSTTALAADMNLMKSNLNDRAHIGLGLFMYSDQGGDAKFGTRQAMMSVSGILPVGGGHIFSVGIQGGVAYRDGFIHNLSFENQWNGSAFDPTMANGESGTISSFIYPDIAAGINYLFDGNRTSFMRNHDTKFNIGVAVHHANAPEMKYFSGYNEKMPRKYVANLSFARDFNTYWRIEASAVQTIQGAHTMSLAGLMLKYRTTTGSKVSGLRQASYFGFGMHTRIQESIIPMISYDKKGFKIALSYDFALTELRRINGGGSAELSLSYRNLNHALFKRRRF